MRALINPAAVTAATVTDTQTITPTDTTASPIRPLARVSSMLSVETAGSVTEVQGLLLLLLLLLFLLLLLVVVTRYL